MNKRQHVWARASELRKLLGRIDSSEHVRTTFACTGRRRSGGQHLSTKRGLDPAPVPLPFLPPSRAHTPQRTRKPPSPVSARAPHTVAFAVVRARACITWDVDRAKVLGVELVVEAEGARRVLGQVQSAVVLQVPTTSRSNFWCMAVKPIFRSLRRAHRGLTWRVRVVKLMGP